MRKYMPRKKIPIKVKSGYYGSHLTDPYNIYIIRIVNYIVLVVRVGN